MMKKLIPAFIFLLFCLANVKHVSAQTDSINWSDFNTAVNTADVDEKMFFLFFEAEWCGFCKQMRSEVFPLDSVREKVERGFVSVAIDIESDKKMFYQDEEMTQKSFSHQMRIDATPTIMFMNGNGEVIGRYRGFADKNDFTLLLDYVREGEVEKVDFAEYKKRNKGSQN